MSNLMKTFGLFFIFSAVSASYNLYLNEHETMRLLGELMIISFVIFFCKKTGISWGQPQQKQNVSPWLVSMIKRENLLLKSVT